MAKKILYYPQIVINSVEINIPDSELESADMGDFNDVKRLAEKYFNYRDFPSYDYPDFVLCKTMHDTGLTNQFGIKVMADMDPF